MTDVFPPFTTIPSIHVDGPNDAPAPFEDGNLFSDINNLFLDDFNFDSYPPTLTTPSFYSGSSPSLYDPIFGTFPTALGTPIDTFPTTLGTPDGQDFRLGPVVSKAMLEANGRRRRYPPQFECSECHQTFTALFSLKRHSQSHTGERSFVCSIPGCSQRFWNVADRKRHEKSRKHHQTLPKLPLDLTRHISRDGEFPVAAGGFADIFKGKYHVPQLAPVEVAIKAIKVYSEELNCPKKAMRLQREIKVWTKLNHTNVVSLLGTTSGFGPSPAMVCPWLENGTLTSYLERQNGKLEMQQILALIHDVASGLQYLHSQSIAHGDLSGSNVLIDINAKACLADFGLSRVLDEIGSTFGTSSTGMRKGTLRWAAPELLGFVESTETPHAGPTIQSDIYSFGGIMLQILTGKVPYHYYSRDVQILGALFKGETPRRPDHASVTDCRWVFLQRCWSPFKDVVRRPPSEEIVAFSKGDLSGRGDIYVS